jgi:hypothetical protein
MNNAETAAHAFAERVRTNQRRHRGENIPIAIEEIPLDCSPFGSWTALLLRDPTGLRDPLRGNSIDRANVIRNAAFHPPWRRG